jgi:hypothetical protein
MRVMNFGEVANRLFGGSPERVQSFLYATEQRLVQSMARAAPRWIAPAPLSLIGAGGAARRSRRRWSAAAHGLSWSGSCRRRCSSTGSA